MLTTSSLHSALGDFKLGLLSYLFTSVFVWLGITFSLSFIPHNRISSNALQPDFITACSRFDGIHYADITLHGYCYNSQKRSTVAFFPAYPVMSQFVATITEWDAKLTLLVVSNVMLLGSFIILCAYLRSRCSQDDIRTRLLVLSVFGVWPAGLFFRMAYSESTFLFFTLLTLCGMARRWPLLVIAFFAGCTTATRPVGLAVTAAVAWYALTGINHVPIIRRLVHVAIYSPIACWGLIGYMFYQYNQFDTPFAFAQTQENWATLARSKRDLGRKMNSLLALEPIWGVYVSDPVRSCWRLGPQGNVIFNLYFWNPILFVLPLAFVVFGAAKSWLSGPEIVLGIGLLAIPYVTRAYEYSMRSHARFAAVVIPAYLVLGGILRSLPQWVTWSTLGIFSTLLMAWSALFAAGYPFF